MNRLRKRLAALLLVLLCVLPQGPRAAATDAEPCLTLDSSFVIIGDSNTVFLNRYNPELEPVQVFARVNARIGETVRDAEVNADGYELSIKQLIDGLTGEDFSTVIVNMGTNNLGLNMNSFKSDYSTLLERLYEKNPDAVIYLCLILPVDPEAYPGPYYESFTPENVQTLNAAVTEVRQRFADEGYDARLMDLNTPFSDENGYLTDEYGSGGVHLTYSGYRKLNRVIQARLSVDEIRTTHRWGAPRPGSEPTCTQPGTEEVVCSLCGTVKPIPVAEPLGHSWIPVEILANPAGGTHGTARYACTRCGETKEAPMCACEVFTDAPAEDHWAHAGVDWAFFGGITNGTSGTTFGPREGCTRAQVVTFLWRAAGCPDPAAASSSFKDVKAGSFYEQAVLWAVETGITKGTSRTTFSPGKICSRGEVVTFLWRAAGSPAPSQTDPGFTDLKAKAYYLQAVLWAVEAGITNGTSDTEFSPDGTCTRAHVVTFLYRFVGEDA